MKSPPLHAPRGRATAPALWLNPVAIALACLLGQTTCASTRAEGAAVTTRRSSLSTQSQSSTTSPAAVALVEGETVTKQVRGGVAEGVGVSASAGQYVRVVFVWRGVDLEASVVGPGGTRVGGPPVPILARGPVSVSFVTEAAGEYQIEVRPVRDLKVNGAYAARLEAVRPPNAADELRIRAERALAAGSHPATPASKERLEEALRLWREAEDVAGQAATLQALADLNYSTDLQGAAAQYQAAIALRRQMNDTAGEAHTLIDLGNAFRKSGDKAGARPHYERALALFRGVGDRVGESRALYIIGLALATTGEYQAAMPFYEQALAIQRADGDRPREASTLNAMGGAYDRLGDYDKALDFYQGAARIYVELGDADSRALTLNNISAVNVTLGNWQSAKESYANALALYEVPLGKNFTACASDGSQQTRKLCGYAAYTLGNVGELYNTLGDPEAALDELERAYLMHTRLKDYTGQGLARSHMCYSKLLQGEPREALNLCGEALSLQTQPDGRTPRVDPPMLAYTFTVMGMVYDALGEAAPALSYYDRASSFHLKNGDARALAITLDKAGVSLARGGDAKGALEKFEQALSLWGRIKDRDGEALTLYQAARAERGRGNLVKAHARISDALDIVETLRANVSAQRLRASYFAQKLDYYELAIDLKMQLAKAGGLGVAAPEALVASALQTSERASARVLFDILAEARVEPSDGSDPALEGLLRRRQALQQKLDYKAALQTKLLAGNTPAGELATLEKELAQLAAEYDDVDARVRARNPRYAELARPQPLSVAEIQSQLLDEETLLLEYALGEERSYLWVVSRHEVKPFELPGRSEIEGAARRVRDILRDEQKRRGEPARVYETRLAGLDGLYRKEAARLSEMLLGPAASELGRKRLLVAAGGELQQVPFAALPAPVKTVAGRVGRLNARAFAPATQSAPPLAEAHEIINLPSASTLAALRAMTRKRQRPSMSVAVLADPVFDSDDRRLQEALGKPSERVTPAPRPPSMEVAVRSFGASLPRLMASRREANAIVALAPADTATASLDFAANRTTATAAELSRYRIVHFATHAVFNDRQPELSGVVLSFFDERGQPRDDGFLRLHDVYNLSLPVDMVVLSACQTGLGKQVRGEGLIGLTRGFMYAGAPRVVASLWKVDDEATAELMKLFYRHMLRDGMSPPAALRRAQMTLRLQRRWSAPYYWAGFILHGEWK